MKKVEHLVDNISSPASPTIPQDFPSSLLKGGSAMSSTTGPSGPQPTKMVSVVPKKSSGKTASATRNSFWPLKWLFSSSSSSVGGANRTSTSSNTNKKLPSSAVMVKSLSESLKVATCSSPTADPCDQPSRGSAPKSFVNSRNVTFRQSFSFNDVDIFAEKYNLEALGAKSKKDPASLISLSPSLSTSSTKLSSTLTSSPSATNHATNLANLVVKKERSQAQLDLPQSLKRDSHYRSNIDIAHFQRKSNSFRSLRDNKRAPYHRHSDAKDGYMAKRQMCKLCWLRKSATEMHSLWNCGCCFCRDCLRFYLELNIREGNLSALTCPDAECPVLASSKAKSPLEMVVASQEIALLVSPSIYQSYKRYRVNWLVEQDPYRVWCPTPNCETICTIPRQHKSGPGNNNNNNSSSKKSKEQVNNALPVFCNTCRTYFCATCKRKLSNTDSHFCNEDSASKWNSIAHELSLDPELEENIKRCPRCFILIERDEGCAQMMCRSCKHVFCWFCLSSLEVSIILLPLLNECKLRWPPPFANHINEKKRGVSTCMYMYHEIDYQ